MNQVDMHASFEATSSLPDAFPTALRLAVDNVVHHLPGASHGNLGTIDVVVDGEAVVLPHRIYTTPFTTSGLDLPPLEATELHCMYSRHHDGFVRQRSAEALLESPEPWVVPFVVQLIGEYVVEIVEAIALRLPALLHDQPHATAYARFIRDNPSFVRLTRQRAISYWSCYYRRRFLTPEAYPGVDMVDRLVALPSSACPRGPGQDGGRV